MRAYLGEKFKTWPMAVWLLLLQHIRCRTQSSDCAVGKGCFGCCQIPSSSYSTLLESIKQAVLVFYLSCLLNQFDVYTEWHITKTQNSILHGFQIFCMYWAFFWNNFPKFSLTYLSGVSGHSGISITVQNTVWAGNWCLVTQHESVKTGPSVGSPLWNCGILLAICFLWGNNLQYTLCYLCSMPDVISRLLLSLTWHVTSKLVNIWIFLIKAALCRSLHFCLFLSTTPLR